jgi:hypothetical protein
VNDYGVYPFSQVRGELYSGMSRAATWHEESRGNYVVSLYKRVDGSDTKAAEGSTVQAEKAQSLCEIWVRDGRIPESMTAVRS